MRVLVIGAALLLSLSALGAQETGVQSKPLDWRSVKLPVIDYAREPVDDGAGIYSVLEKSSKKFRVKMVFMNGMYAFSEDKSASFKAFADNLLEGGAGKRSFEDLNNFATENAFSIETAIDQRGHLVVAVSGLLTEFPKAVELLEDVILRPRFDSKAFEVWRQEGMDAFDSVMDGGSSRKQARFVSLQLNKMIFGPKHFLTQTLRRQSPVALKKISVSEFAPLAKRVLVRTGMTVVASGGLGSSEIASLKKLMRKLPKGTFSPSIWLPARPLEYTSPKVKLAVIQKPDMKQASGEVRIVVPAVGELNTLEETDVSIAEEVLSASGGVVGNDRWSKAMRADSGLSYSAQASFISSVLEPNTNTGMWRLIFQSPLDRADEACSLAKKTWDDYARGNVSNAELEMARVSGMNALLAREETVFDRAAKLESALARGYALNTLPIETTLAHYDALVGKVDRVNGTLSRLAAANPSSYMVLMGNFSKEKLDKLAAMPGFELIETVAFSDLVNAVSAD
jgi:predicted Zn-dependent peptidase